MNYLKNIEEIPYGELIKYRDIMRIFNLEYKVGKEAISQIKKISKYYLINKEGKLYKIIRKFSNDELKLNSKIKLPLNFKINEEDRNDSGIYIIELGIKVYIGQTNNFLQRYNQHIGGFHESCDTQSLLNNGGEFSVLEFEDNREKRLIKESEYIKKYVSKGYEVLNSTTILYNSSSSMRTAIDMKSKDFDKIIKFLRHHNIEFEYYEYDPFIKETL